jgi:hypothetical protein
LDIEWIDLEYLNSNISVTLSAKSKADAYLIGETNKRIDLSSIETIWWRRGRIPKEDPKISNDLKNYIHLEWKHFILGIEAFTNSRWVNSPIANYKANIKSFQLVVALQVGLEIPETRITNDPHSVQELFARSDSVIFKHIGDAQKPLTGTRELNKAHLDKLDILKNCPAIFQENIKADLDIRVTAFGTSMYAIEIESQNGQSPLDWRFDHTVQFREHSLNGSVSSKLFNMMKIFGLEFCIFDLRLTKTGTYIFLEINPNGQYLFLELLTQIPLSNYMAEFLLKKP